MLFDIYHILYMVISGLLTAGGLIAAVYFCKTQKQKDFVLRLSAIVTVILHYSNLWVDYLNTGTAEVENNHLFPIYPCNVMMWMLVAVAFIKKREGVPYTLLAEFVFWAGVVCGSVGIILNKNYANTPDLRDYDIFKGLISHSTMLFGCIYMLVGKYIRIRVFNALSCLAGMVVFVLDGLLMDWLFVSIGKEPVDGMFLRETPLAQFPNLSVWVLAPLALLIIFAGLALYEQKCLPEEERWYTRLKERKNKNTKENNV